MTVLDQANDSMSGFGEREARQFRRIFVVSVGLFLVVGAFARLLPRNLRPWRSARAQSGSLVSEAKSAANRFIPFAFMG
jgi:hypothetical protein